MRIGYARVSKDTQQDDLQINALKGASCDMLFSDVGTGKKFNRKGLIEALAYAQPGDVLVVWKLDRLGRSTIDLINTVRVLADKGVDFISLTEHLETTTPSGKLTFHIFCALAEFERDLIRERVNAGLATAREKEHHLGRPHPKATDERVVAVKQMLAQGVSTTNIAQTLHMSTMTVYSYMRDPELDILTADQLKP